MAKDDLNVEYIDQLTPFTEKVIEEMPTALEKGILRAAQHAEGVVKKVVRESFDHPTGQLSRSFRSTFLYSRGNEVAAGAFSDLIYAEIQDQGGTITPKTVSRLAVPVSDKAKKTAGLWPRHWPKGVLTYLVSKKKNEILAEVKRAKGGKTTIKPHYVLKRSVTIKGRGYIEKAKSIARPEIAEILGDAIDAVLE